MLWEKAILSLAQGASMAFVVCEPCLDCKYTDCVVVCPMECFYQDEHMLYIDPQSCIDCYACMSECPVEAIFPDPEVPEKWHHFIELNARRSAELKDTGWIREKQPPLRDCKAG